MMKKEHRNKLKPEIIPKVSFDTRFFIFETIPAGGQFLMVIGGQFSMVIYSHFFLMVCCDDIREAQRGQCLVALRCGLYNRGAKGLAYKKFVGASRYAPGNSFGLVCYRGLLRYAQRLYPADIHLLVIPFT